MVLRSTGLLLLLLGLLLAALAYVFRGPLTWHGARPARRGAVSAERLEHTVRTLCAEYTPRWYMPPQNMARAAGWIAARLRETGLEVREQSYRLREGEYTNVIATQHGTEPGPVIVVGAHYDAYGDMPGADDNASGVAVLLELARTVEAAPPKRTRIFVAFANEEPPFFGTEDMGSYRVLQWLQAERVEIDLMIALDLVGYYADEPGSQRFPSWLIRLFYPSRGNFLAVVGDLGAGGPIGRVRRGLRAGSRLPVYSFRGPRIVPGVAWSDHYWFRELGLPAVLVTNTAMLRNPHYHRRTDLPDTLDYARMAEVVQGLHGVLQDE